MAPTRHDVAMFMPELESSRPAAAEEREPAYLEDMWSTARDESLSEGERGALRSKYYAQYTKWRTYQARVTIAIANLGASDFWQSMVKALREHGLCGDAGSPAAVEKVICLCLGSLEDNATVYQTALLILLLERLGIQHEQCSIFDPCHSSQEIDVLEHLGFKILNDNKEAKIRVRQKTLVYMPHGDYGLTENLIGANRECLHHLVILGNNLGWVCNSKNKEATAAKVAIACAGVATRAPHVQKVLTLVKETQLEDSLTCEVRSQVVNLAPAASKLLAGSMCASLDCTLSTFPTNAPSHLESAL